MNRITAKFNQLKQDNKKALIPYICSGDPSAEATEQLIYALEEAGADVIELGVPFSDPLADGPVIQNAALRSLNGGFKVDMLFDIVKNARKNSRLPLVCMVYYSVIIGYGKERFINNCVDCGLDGLIVPDLPYEEYDELKPLIDKTDLCMIPLIAITSEERIPMLVEGCKGFVYCVSSLGVTGERKAFDKRVDAFVEKVKAATDVPTCIGFGISTHEDVARFDKVADGCIVGSAIVRKIFDSNMNLDEIKAFVRELKG